MPTVSTCKRWLGQIITTYNDQQHLRLEQALESDDSPMSDGSGQGSDNGLEDLDDPATLQATMASLTEELAELSVDLDMEMLDLDMQDENMGDWDPQSPVSSHSSPTFSDMEDEIESHSRDRLATLLKYMKENHVLEPRPTNPKASQLYLLDHWADHNLRTFRAKLRVNPTTFKQLLELLKDHHIFYNNSNSPQLPIEVQLAIYLARAGHYGNGSSVVEIATWAGVSVGLVRKATVRVMIALISLHNIAIRLPTDTEKEASKQWVEDSLKCPEWRNGFVTVDGTKFPLFLRPGLHGDAWFDKNKDYSADAQVCFNIGRQLNDFIN